MLRKAPRRLVEEEFAKLSRRGQKVRGLPIPHHADLVVHESMALSSRPIELHRVAAGRWWQKVLELAERLRVAPRGGHADPVQAQPGCGQLKGGVVGEDEATIRVQSGDRCLAAVAVGQSDEVLELLAGRGILARASVTA